MTMQRVDTERGRFLLDRRSAVAGVALGAYGFANGFAWGVDDDMPSIPIIDCHTHFYDPSRPEGVPWPDKNDSWLYRTVLPEDYKRLARPLGIVGTVVVEASPWVEDNQWLLDLASRDPFLVGIVGRIDISSVDFPQHLGRFARNPLYRGIRILSDELIQGLEAGGQLLDHCRLLIDHNLELDVNGGPNTPQLVARLATELPRLRMVINHVGNLPIDGLAPPRAWIEGMENAAKHPNVFCKVSALVEQTGKSPAPNDNDFYAPVLTTLWRVFGEDRLIFGSNWPVSDRGAPLESVVKIVRNFFMTKGERIAKKFFQENSRNAYLWGR